MFNDAAEMFSDSAKHLRFCVQPHRGFVRVRDRRQKRKEKF